MTQISAKVMYSKYEESDDSIGWSGNFKGFVQYRKTLPNENITK